MASICRYCKKVNLSVFTKCNSCRLGNTIFSNGKTCYACNEKRIPIENEEWQSYCNRCFMTSVSSPVLHTIPPTPSNSPNSKISKL